MTEQNNQQKDSAVVAQPAATSRHTGRKWAVGILIFLGIILLIVGGWQAAPDSALGKWEASRKEKEAAKAALEPAG
jgi:hypothetical protein